MLPESELVMGELVVRKLSLPDNMMSKKALVRWLALALGLISESESRQLVLSIFESVLTLAFKQESFSSSELIEAVKKDSPDAQEKAIRYHISQLKKRGILFEKDRKYYLGDPTLGQTPEERLRKMYQGEFDQSFTSIARAFQRVRVLQH